MHTEKRRFVYFLMLVIMEVKTLMEKQLNIGLNVGFKTVVLTIADNGSQVYLVADFENENFKIRTDEQ
jgi:hypothetical protein